MGTCIICGTPVDGRICSSHEEDVAFEFRGDSPDQLTTGRYYRGSVDGYADFGVFVNIGDHVTGLLHKSELDQRLESLDWDVGDTVYAQVTDVRDNGNVDLGWSIRQSEREFRGSLVDDPNGKGVVTHEELDEEESTETASDGGDGGHAGGGGGGGGSGGGTAATSAGVQAVGDTRTESEPETTESAASAAVPEADDETEPEPEAEAELNRTTVDTLGDRVGDAVRVEGEVVGVRQTGGPTIFELRDETGTIECAAFVEAGVRAYPEVEVEDLVRLDGEVEMRRDELQIETESLDVLAGEKRQAVADRLAAAMDEKARPEKAELLAEHPTVESVHDEVVEVATAIRRAVMEARPVVVRHSATADGYLAGAALERAILPLVREEHTRADAEYHFFERRPLDDEVYDMQAATNDVTDMLEARERHGEQLPLVVLADAGSTAESVEGYGLLDVYGADRVVVDSGHPDDEVVDAVEAVVNPFLGDSEAVEDATTTALAANVAAHVNSAVRADLGHLPAVSYWTDTPAAYTDLATEAGYDDTETRDLREAVALEAYYQSFSDKRQLIADLLFGETSEDEISLAAHVGGQFREKVDRELTTAEHNLSTREARGVTFAVLDTDAHTHRFDFPPTELLLSELHRHKSEDGESPLVTLGVGDDEIHVRCTEPLDVRRVGEKAAERAPDAGISVVGGRDGRVEFLTGERDSVLEGVVAAIADEIV